MVLARSHGCLLFLTAQRVSSAVVSWNIHSGQISYLADSVMHMRRFAYSWMTAMLCIMHSTCTRHSCSAKALSRHSALNFESHFSCTRPNCSWNSSPPSEPARDVSIEIRAGYLQTLLTDFEVLEFLAANDDYVCQACGDLIQKNIRVQPVGRAVLLHLKRFAFDRVGGNAATL